MPFVKLDCGILDSTLWVDREAREIFITALLMAVPHSYDSPVDEVEITSTDLTGWSVPPGDYGFVPAASVGICRRAGMEQDVGIAALIRLSQPEAESRSPDFSGRRMIRVNGGFLILNFHKYREKDHTAAIRAKRYRDKKRAATKNVTPLTDVTPLRHAVTARSVTQAEAEAEAEADAEARKKKGGEIALPENLNLSVWQEWVDYRRARKLPTYKTAQKAKELAALTTDAQLECVKYSTGNNYNVLFPDKFSGTEKSGQKSNFDKQTDTLKEWLDEQSG